uniref:Metalloendopeptidase n=1 Tax=Parastrongyloides trichosuri TaxID=131310 RepID=A0A0N5A5S1_PARTI
MYIFCYIIIFNLFLFVHAYDQNNGAIDIDQENFRFYQKRDIYKNPTTNWTYTIKYYIDGNLSPSKIKSVVRFLMDETCLKFEESHSRETKVPQIEYIYSSTCLADIGKLVSGKNNRVQLTYQCSTSFGTTGHETLHALGVGHEHQRGDRDSYVKINRNNIQSGYEENFNKHDTYKWLTFEIPYDYASIMHYRKNSLGKYGRNTLEAKNIEPFNNMMGHESVFSFNDIKLVNYYYCRNECSFPTIVCKNGGYVRDPKCNVCVCPKEFGGRDCSNVKDRSYSCNLQTLYAFEGLKQIYSVGKKRCIFHIKSHSGKRISLFINLVITMEKETCVSDVGLDIKYLKDKGVTGLCLCGKYEKIKIYSESSDVLVTYTGLEDGHMFYADYKEISLNDDIKSVLCYNDKCYKNNELVTDT